MKFIALKLEKLVSVEVGRFWQNYGKFDTACPKISIFAIILPKSANVNRNEFFEF